MACGGTCLEILDVLRPDFIVPDRLSMNVEEVYPDQFLLQCFLVEEIMKRFASHGCVVQRQSHLIIWWWNGKIRIVILRMLVIVIDYSVWELR